MILALLNMVQSEKLIFNHNGTQVFRALVICKILGFTEEKFPTWKNLKETEYIDIQNAEGIYDLYVTESGVYKLIMVGTSPTAIMAREMICEEILPKLSEEIG